MAIPNNINKSHIQKAISEILKKNIPSARKEVHYSLIVNGVNLPPKYILSVANIYANGIELDSKEFISNEARAYLEKKGFEIYDSRKQKNEHFIRIWIEKTIVNGRTDRLLGERALGKAIWSPQRDKRGADIYKCMREVSVGDIILHLINNSEFCGVSVVKSKAIETIGVTGTEWDGPAYLIDLKDYTLLEPSINRNEILNEENKSILDEISKSSEVFYNNRLDLRQGAYITPCPIELANLINRIYLKKTNQNIPFLKFSDSFTMNENKDLSFDLKSLDLRSSGLIFSKSIITRFTSSLLTKPFVILTGLSGSGKTKLAQAFAMWLSADKSQYKIVPVGADWTNREPLLGFPNALQPETYVKPDSGVLDLIIAAKANPKKPYFLILDEMNLSHVERYFADFLSAMESGEEVLLHAGELWSDVPAKLVLPKNLFIVGTVNIDETTYMFSPKVLDRANVIEFRVTKEEMSDYLSQSGQVHLDTLKGKGAAMEQSFVQIAANKEISYSKYAEMTETLVSFFEQLKVAGAEFGYRTASEIKRFAAVTEQLETGWSTAQILDAAIMQKLLPKLHGSRRKLEPVLKTLISLCIAKGEKPEDYIAQTHETDSAKVLYPVSLEKIQRMYRGLIDNGFTSYAEA